jgi:hypothetical protein
MKTKTAHDIKHRDRPNDEFFTPRMLAESLFKIVPAMTEDLIMDNAYGTGNFYFGGLKSTDFLNDHRKVDWYITNPPYSFLDKWLEKSCEANKGFAYLLGINNLTAKRIEDCENRGFYVSHIHLCKVFKWFGMSAFVVWEKKNNNGSIKMSYDRIVWR